MSFFKDLFAGKKASVKTPEERKVASIQRLKKEGIPYIEHLPVIESAEQVRPRSLEEIACRAISSLLIIQAALDIENNNYNEESRQWLQDKLQQYGVQEELTPKERAVLEDRADPAAIINMVWKYEAYWSLIWYLGLVDALPFPDKICDCDAAIDAVASAVDFQEFLRKCQPRSLEELLDEDDLIYRYHWACVDARIHDQPAPAGLDESVVLERRSGLDWLLGLNTAQDWDAVELHT